jgi:predicted phosphodiesterase
MTRAAAALFAASLLAARDDAPTPLPLVEGSLRFAVLGNSGKGRSAPEELAERLAARQEQVGFKLVLLTGDNVVGPPVPSTVRARFEEPFEDLLDVAVEFRAVLGNDDDPAQRSYDAFHMEGRRYYSFRPPGASARVFALDSTYLDAAQLTWLDAELGAAKEDWKIWLLHHPLWSGEPSDVDRALREGLLPLAERHGVDVVFAGHEHAYERGVAPGGIVQFVSGGAVSGSPRGRRSEIAQVRYDRSPHFVACEIEGDRLHFEAVDERGRVIDSGVVTRRAAREGARP